MKNNNFLTLLFLVLFNQSKAQEFAPGHYYHPAFQNGKYGYINSNGEWMINAKYDWCDYYYDGKAIVKEKGKFGFINAKGELIIPAIYDTAKHYSEGMAAVASRNEEGRINWDFIDSAGTHLNIKVPALSNVTSFNSGRSVATEDGFLNFYFFKRNGDTAFSARGFYLDENRVPDYSEGLLHVYFGEMQSTFIDTNGIFWGKGDFENCGDFHDGMAWVQQGFKIGFINTKGEMVIAPQFDSVGNFNEGIALAKIKMTYDQNLLKMSGGVIEYIDKEGNIVAPPIYSDGTSFNDGFAFVKFNDHYGFINSNGEVVIDYQYETGKNFFRGLAYVKKENHWEYINTKGNKVF